MDNTNIFLGINYIGYDTSSCLVRDGNLIAAFEEERLNRSKYTFDFPRRGIGQCLSMGGIDLEDVGCITLNWNPWKGVMPRAWNALRHSPLSLFGFGVPSGRASLSSWLDIVRLSRIIAAEFGVPSARIAPKIKYITHHVAHNASSYYVSGFERSALLSLDGAGEWVTTVRGLGEGVRMKALRTVNFPHSIGFLYQTITEFLGFGTIAGTEGGEGKVMGLAAYGDPARFETQFKQLFELTPGGFRLNLKFFSFLFDAENS